MIKSIIIDDDSACIKLVEGLLKIYCPDVTVLATCSGIRQAVEIINTQKPELVFLDVELNGEMGFDLFRYFPKPEFKVIFTTAHEKFAIKAIKSSCLDFILKPVDPQELVAAVEKLKESNSINTTIPVLLNNIANPEKVVNKIAVPAHNEFVFIDIDQIICLEGEAKYTTIYTIKGDKIVASKNLGEYEELLSAPHFFRCHKAWIINLNYARKFLKSNSQVVLENNLTAEVSSRKKDDLIKLFSKA